jgi:chromosome segregation ATPase
MEFEQIIKRLDWLDEEHRKDKNILSSLEEKLNSVDTSLGLLGSQLKELGKQTSSLSSALARIDQFDEALGQHRLEINHFIDGLEKRRVENQRATDKQHHADIDELNKAVTHLKKSGDIIKEIKRELKSHTDEELRLGREMADLANKIDELKHSSEDLQRTQKITDETRRQDVKRISDLQSDNSALRKRIEKAVEKSDIASDNVRRVETRLSELLASEADRRQSQTVFIENQSRSQIEHDRSWKEWEARFESIIKQSESLEVQLREWDTTQRTVKRAQETYDELIQKFERRINEISEMQRLAEDRFRQEWTTFKADDQKRWTGHSMTQDETNKDTRSEIQKISERMALVEDLSQTQQDVLQQTQEANEQLLHAMVSQIHELLSAYERIMGSTK